MRGVLKSAAWFVAVACLVWVGVLWRWRATQRDFDGGDVAVYLVVLPVTVFALAWAARWAIGRALLVQNAEATRKSAVQGSSGKVAPAPEADSAPTTWHLLSAAIRTAAGDTVDELLAATEAGAPRPAPDAEFQDEDGLPVMIARIADVDVAPVESALARLAGNPPFASDEPIDAHGSAPETAAHAIRALAILQPLIDEAWQSIASGSGQWGEAAMPAAGPATRPASPSSASAPTDRLVRFLAAWPSDWGDATCAAAEAWLNQHLSTLHVDGSPVGRPSVQSQRMSGAELLVAAERTLAALRREDRDDPLVLLACHSDLDSAAIQALERQQRLFHPTRRPKVAMAGEAAAVLVVSAVAWPADMQTGAEPVRFMVPAVARRIQSIEAPGRAASEETVALARRCLAAAGFAGEAVATIASDADQHTARATELFAVTLALTPELDANDDFRLVGTLTGRLEAVAPLVTLACAAAQTRESGRPALALSLGDPHWRAIAVLCPESFSAATGSATA